MKNFLNLLSLCASLSAFLALPMTAQARLQNPQIRKCHQAGGQFVAVDLININGNQDQLGLCHFDQDAYLGALDVMSSIDKTDSSQSIVELQANAGACNGEVIQATTLEGLAIELCQYSDLSAVSTITLQSGLNSPENSKLKNFLDSN